MNYEVKGNYLFIDLEGIYYSSVQDLFDELIPSKKIQHLLIQNKWITMDDNPVKRETALIGKKLKIDLYSVQTEYPIVETKPDIVYEDELFLIVNKPNGLLVHKDGNSSLTLTDIVGSYLRENNIPGEAKAIHRLDVDTSGLVVFVKSMIFQPLLDRLLMYKQIKRSYIAIVEGRCDFKRQTIEKNIGSDRHDSRRMVIAKRGRSAKTTVYNLYSCGKYSVLRCELRDGRTHQIRVHLASIGHPIINDELYGTSSPLLKRMGLVANEVEFYHPLKVEMMKVKIRLDSDFRKLMEYVDEEEL